MRRPRRPAACTLPTSSPFPLPPSRVSLSSLCRGTLLHIRSRKRLQLLDVLRIHRLSAAETRLVRRPELVVLVAILPRQQALAREIVRHGAVLDDGLGGFFAWIRRKD